MMLRDHTQMGMRYSAQSAQDPQASRYRMEQMAHEVKGEKVIRQEVRRLEMEPGMLALVIEVAP